MYAEAVINSRPLNYLSEDPDDLTPLTPSMFLQDIQTVGVPDLDNIDNINLTKRLGYQQRLRNDLRKRFRDEYLFFRSSSEQQSWFERSESCRCGAHWLRQQEET
ncbi:integrase catalytic domain-containing protein [Trichonephila inaurata madagascariensis]|uniref:Integrase catalytic domain-containing protein n=1 Tax=Trichonephila inaurata madagascariensis TaxID=2747483 RepID=A0A8X6JHH1_9ARAC|nr:integrase catalytic domain-containing protein [Trichonephila inaurata madagascariensis]